MSGGIQVTGGKVALALATSVLAWVALAPVTALASNDPLFPQRWGLSGAPASINGPQAWCCGSGGVLVADVASQSSPSPSLSPTSSPSPLFNVIPNNSPDVAPGTILASSPPGGGTGTTTAVLGVLLALGVAAGYGGTLGVARFRRARAAQAAAAASSPAR